MVLKIHHKIHSQIHMDSQGNFANFFCRVGAVIFVTIVGVAHLQKEVGTREPH